MKLQKITLTAAVALALSGAAYANDNKATPTTAQNPSDTATQKQAASDTAMPSSPGNGQGVSANSQSSVQAGDESVRKLQQDLKDKGFDPGPIDGVNGPKTQAALRKSQESSTSSQGPSSSESTAAPASTSGTSASTQSSTDSSSSAQPAK